MRRPNLGSETMLRQRPFDPRDEICPICIIVDMLELASATLWEVVTRRLLVVRAEREPAVVEQRVARHSEWDVAAACRHSVATGSNADDKLVHLMESIASGIARTRSSAIISGPAIAAARA